MSKQKSSRHNSYVLKVDEKASGTDTIELQISPQTPNGKGTRTRRHKIKTLRAESQEDSNFPVDGHKAILNKMNNKPVTKRKRPNIDIWAPSSEFVSSSIPSWQILTAHAQPFRGARDLAFCLKVPLDSLLIWASSEGSGETARMRRLAWTFAARIGYKYQIRLTRSN